MALMTMLRNRMHVVLWSLLILFLLSMTVGGLVGGANIIDQLLGRVNPAEAIGSINGSKITPDQFNQAVSMRLESLRSSGMEISDQQLSNIRVEVWNAFVDERLTEQAIKDLNMVVSDDVARLGDDKTRSRRSGNYLSVISLPSFFLALLSGNAVLLSFLPRNSFLLSFLPRNSFLLTPFCFTFCFASFLYLWVF